jgi:hypothetical protein
MKALVKFNRLVVTCLAVALTVLFITGGLGAASGPDTFRFVVYADSRGNSTQGQEINQDCLNYINNQIFNLDPKPDLVFFLGDMVTMAYDASQKRLLPDWRNLMETAGFSFGGPSPGKIPLYVAIGNHEVYDSTGHYQASLQGEFQAFFPEMPDNGPTAYKRLAYTVEFGNSLFIVLDSFGFKSGDVNWDNGIDELQYWWFYATALQSQANHKFVLTHGPAYDPEGWTVDPSMKTLWQTMKNLAFNIYFCGHDHFYSRWNPDDSRLTQIISGSAGAAPSNPQNLKVDRNKAHVYWDYNFTVVDVKGETVTTQAFAVRPRPTPTQTVKIDPIDRNSATLLLLD